MIVPELKNLIGFDLDYGKTPADPDDCEIHFDVDIGPKGVEGADIFFLTVITPKRLAKITGNRWGKGLLIVESFSWRTVEDEIEKLLSHCGGADWVEVANKLNKVLDWEFENYQEALGS